MLEKVQAIAIESFVLKVTIPLLYERSDGKTMLFGTGTLFSILGRYLVITAAHPFWEKGINLERLAFPVHPASGGIHTFGQFERAIPRDRRFDVAALELTDPVVVSRLQSHWSFLALDNIAPAMPMGRSFLTGYPEDLIRTNSKQIGGLPFTIYSEPLLEIPADALEPVTPGLDLFFRYGSEAETLDGTTVSTPNLKGTSGASVWQLQEIPSDAVWAPERAVRVIGVQSAAAHSQYFRAINWWGVAQLLAQLGGELQEHLLGRLGPVR